MGEVNGVRRSIINLIEELLPEPVRHALERIGPCRRVRAGVSAAAAIDRERQTGPLLQRPVRMIEVVIRAAKPCDGSAARNSSTSV